MAVEPLTKAWSALLSLFPFPTTQSRCVRGHTLNTRRLIYCQNLHHIHLWDSSYKRGVHCDTKHTWGKENRPLYCSRIISLVFQTRINVSWCCCIVLIGEERLLTLLLNWRLCWPMWGNAGEGLWLLLSCSSKVKGRRCIVGISLLRSTVLILGKLFVAISCGTRRCVELVL